ncbi:MAG: helix-turn-helix transcriptional regulator [Xanthobacteraceae bacterium]|nr:helix-turn-helix transcriptional regulator [Xanthobacteraceae bacterium]
MGCPFEVLSASCGVISILALKHDFDSSNSADTVRSQKTRAKPSALSGGGAQPGDAGCRVDDFVKFLAREWTSQIIWKLAREKTMRFGALRRALPGAVSARVLSKRLKELESCGLVSRRDAATLPLRVEYSLTTDGRRLDAALRRGEALTERLRKRARRGPSAPD